MIVAGTGTTPPDHAQQPSADGRTSIEWSGGVERGHVGGDHVDWVARTLDGETVLSQIKAELSVRVHGLLDFGIVPRMTTIAVGQMDDERANTRHHDCLDIGIDSVRHHLATSATQSEVETTVDHFNADMTLHGVVVQSPLPRWLDRPRIVERIDPRKDVFGSHPVNLGRAVLNEEAPLPCAARGCLELLRRYGIGLANAHVVVVGSGATADQLIALLVAQVEVGAIVTLCNVANDVTVELLRIADVIIFSSGLTSPITADLVKPWATVLDLEWRANGTEASPLENAGISVDAGVHKVAKWVAPNGGVRESLTRAMLLTNLVEIAERALASRQVDL